MRYVRMLGLCLVAVCAVAAYVVSSASAKGPEFGQCYAKAGGKYSDRNCQTKAKKGKGAYEWRKAKEVSNSEKQFRGHNVGSGGVLTADIRICNAGTYELLKVSRKKCEEGGGEYSEPAYETYVECESEQNSGEEAGTKEVKNISVIFRGCKLFGTTPCGNSGEEGVIDVNPLKGTLGYIKKSTKEVGVLLEPVTKHGLFAKFACSGDTLEVGAGSSSEGAAYSPESHGGYDGIISPIGPVNTMTPGLTQTYTINSELENIPSHFEGGHDELLETSGTVTENPKEHFVWQKSGETITNENVQESGEEIEIKA